MKPVYKATFKINPVKEGQTLDKIVEEIKTWILPKFEPLSLDNFHTGIDTSKEEKTLKTISVQENGDKHFAMLTEESDWHNKELKWSTNLALSGSEETGYNFSLILRNGWKDGVVRLDKTIVTRPNVIANIVSNFKTQEQYPLYIKPMRVEETDSDRFIKMIYDEQRMLPIVFISCKNETDKPLWALRSPEGDEISRIADKLAGIAHVCVAKNRFVSYSMGSKLERTMNCYNGALRIYWPITRDNIVHPVWLPWEVAEQMEKKKEFNKTLFELIAPFSVSRAETITFEDIGRIAHKQKEKKLTEKINELELQRKKDSDLSEMVDASNEIIKELTEKNQEINTAYKTLEDELEYSQDRERELLAEIRSKEFRITSLEDAIEYQKNKKPEKQEKIPEFKTVQDAADYFKKQEYADDENIEILPKAQKQIKKSMFENPNQAFNAMKWLATEYLNIRAGESKEDLETSCLVNTEMKYVAGQSEITMGEHKQDYFVQIGSKKAALHEHLKKGTGRAPGENLRIAFYYDKEKHKVYIGYFGVHQQNDAT